MDLFKLASSLVLRECDEGLLVYNSRSGNTNLIDQCARRVLQVLDDGKQLSDTELASILDGEAQCDPAAFAATIAALESSGIVSRC